LHEKTLQLERLVTQDTLTGLHNRRHADAFLAREFEQAASRGRPLTVALVDIDRFKQINDGHSHGVGDHVLARVAQIFAERMRASDLVARYGGEEFLFCLIGMNEREAAAFCEDLRESVEREHWSAVSPGLTVTVSIGLAARQDETHAPALLQQADACLYRAKHLGRNRVVSRSSAAHAAPSLARYV
jgi:diguanylate cyclase (GGDEF)-like protein